MAPGNPLPANADGSQAQGTPCNKIPANLINSIGQAMINIYPAPNANNSTSGYNYVNRAGPQLNETKFDARLDQNFSNTTISSPVSATTRHSLLCPAAAPGLAEANAFGSNENLINHARNIGHRLDPRLLRPHAQPGQLGYDRIFDYIARWVTTPANRPPSVWNSQRRSGLLAGGNSLPGAYS